MPYAGCDDVGAPVTVKRRRHNPRASGIPIIPLTVEAHVDDRKSFAELGVAVARKSRFHRMCCLASRATTSSPTRPRRLAPLPLT